MKKSEELSKSICERYARISPFLDERSRRLWIANEAYQLGRGGILFLSKVLGTSRERIRLGISELKDSDSTSLISDSRVRRSGGGRKPISETQPDFKPKLIELIEPHTLGDPMNPLVWCSKSLRHLQNALLEKYGIGVSHVVIEHALHEMNFSLQGNRKTDEGSSEEDRDKQFMHINEKAKSFISICEPVISVDCKKKELIGNYRNAGTEWLPTKSPTEVKVYDFVDKTLGKASPYGVYDVGNNTGWVNVGISSDTAQFAVNAIKTWWDQMGKATYPNATKLLITADSGGSNSSVNKMWKKELQAFATETGMEIHVCHFPPGTSKWNKIEHRMFAHISKNWRGRPLLSVELIVNLIAGTTTEKGLKVGAMKDDRIYQKGLKVSKKEFKNIHLIGDEFREKWNYKIMP